MADGVRGGKAGPASTVDAVRGCKGTRGWVGVLDGIWIGGPTGITGDTFYERHLRIGVIKDVTHGSPASPSLAIWEPGIWRFQWVLRLGTQTISVRVLQEVNASPRPTITVKANPSIGVNVDVVGTAGAGISWVTIGPVSVTSTGIGAVWVELANNYDLDFNCPAYFDFLQTTLPP